MMEISGPVEPRSTDFTRQQIMLRELRYAWERSPPDSLRMWTIDVASMFGTVLVRRGKNLVNVAQTVIKAVGKEIQSGFDAYKYDNLENHWVDRGHAISQSTSNAFSAGHDQVLALKTALQENPKENAPELIVSVLAFLAASGGPDADGGIPDLDLVIGIGAHRSIFTHSIFSGAVVETGLYSVATLIGIVHKNLPLRHDPVWDAVHQNKDKYLSAASKGASAGIAYHLFVDGTVQPGFYHDFPIPMYSEGHQGLFVANAAAEALDVNAKNETFSRQRMHTARAAKQEHVADTVSSAFDLIVFASKLESERVQRNLLASYLIIDHQTYRKRKMEIPESIAKRLHQSHVELLRRYGHWMQALSCGKLFPLTVEQASFISVARGEAAAKSDLEHAWLAYCQFRQ